MEHKYKRIREMVFQLRTKKANIKNLLNVHSVLEKFVKFVIEFLIRTVKK